VSLWGSQALQIGGVAVFIFDYTLTKTGETAWEGRTGLYQKAYALYYKEHPRKSTDWTKRIMAVIDSAKSPVDVHNAIEADLQSYVSEFWGNAETIAAYLDRVKQNDQTGFGGLNTKLENDISAAYKAEIMHVLQETVFPRIPILIANKKRQQVWQVLQELRNGLDQSTTISVQVKSKDSKRSLKNIDVQIETDREPNLWHGVTDNSGHWSMQCTTLGYLAYDAPKKVKVNLPAEGTNAAVTMEVPLSYTPGKTDVIIELDGDGNFVGKIHQVQVVQGADNPVTMDGPVTIAVTPDGSAVMTFTLPITESAGKGAGVAHISASGRLTGTLTGSTFSATGTITSTYATTFKVPAGVKIPKGAGAGSSSAAATATGTLQGDTIKGTIQGGKGVPVHFEATRGAAP
jgi:hypothetical protein